VGLQNVRGVGGHLRGTVPATSTRRVLSLKAALWRRRRQYLTRGFAVLVTSVTCDGRGMRSSTSSAMGPSACLLAAELSTARLLYSFPPLGSSLPFVWCWCCVCCGCCLCRSQVLFVRSSSPSLGLRPARVLRSLVLVLAADAALLHANSSPVPRKQGAAARNCMLSLVSCPRFPSRARHGGWAWSRMGVDLGSPSQLLQLPPASALANAEHLGLRAPPPWGPH